MHTDTYRFFQNHGISRKTTCPKQKEIKKYFIKLYNSKIWFEDFKCFNSGACCLGIGSNVH